LGQDRRKPIFQLLILLTVGFNLYYLSYRLSYTINFEALAFSIIFLLAETHGFVSLWFYFFDLWSTRSSTNAPAPSGKRTIDVFIPTYNEDVAILHRTALAAREMNLPHETYILDDGNRPEVARLAEQLDVHYIARPERVHAKAGNINYALERTHGDLVVIFDADHVPQPDFLERTVGHFNDEKVGFVQTPHVFHNFGSFQTLADFRARKYWDDQQLFFRVIQPGKNRWGTAFFCGSCGIIRRKCIEEIGGLDYRTITEDLHSSLRIQNNGWKSVYHDEQLATGLSPGDLGAYWKQRMRWAVGNLSVLWHDNPLFKSGLSLTQRLSYFSSVWAWTVGPQKLIFYLAPLVMLLTGLYPIARFDFSFFLLYLSNLGFSLLVYKLVSRGYARIIRGEIYSMVNAFMLTAALFRAMFRLGARDFVVTRKGGRSTHVTLYVAPQIALFLAAYWCGLWAYLRHFYNMAQDMTLVSVAGAWTAYNAVLALAAAQLSQRRMDIRRKYRFVRRLPVRYEVSVPDEREKIQGLGTTLDLHEGGMALRTFEALPLGESVALTVFLPGGSTFCCTGRLLYERPRHDELGMCEYGIVLDPLAPEEHAKLDRFIIRFVIPATFHFLARRSPPLRRRLARWFGPVAMRRRFPRRGVQLPVRLAREANELHDDWHVTDDLSRGGMAILFTQPRAVGSETDFTLLLPHGKIEGRARFVREERLHLAGTETYRYGLEFLDLSEEDRDRLDALRRYSLEKEAPR